MSSARPSLVFHLPPSASGTTWQCATLGGGGDRNLPHWTRKSQGDSMARAASMPLHECRRLRKTLRAVPEVVPAVVSRVAGQTVQLAVAAPKAAAVAAVGSKSKSASPACPHRPGHRSSRRPGPQMRRRCRSTADPLGFTTMRHAIRPVLARRPPQVRRQRAASSLCGLLVPPWRGQ